MTKNTLEESASVAASAATAASTERPNSGTLGFVQPADTASSHPHASRFDEGPRGYGALWARLPRELGFLLPTLPVVTVAFVVLVTLFSAGLSLLILFVGLFILVGALYAARGFGVVELTRLRWAGQDAITPPRWTPRGTPSTAMRTVLGPLVSGHYWLYLLHGMVVNFIVGIVSWSLTIVWLSGSIGGLTYWTWSWSLPVSDGNVGLFGLLTDVYGAGDGSAVSSVADNVFNAAVGLAFLLTLPLLTRMLVLLHQGIAQTMLGAWASEALEREVADLSASRGAAVSAEDQSLRRLERDIHDGPQQRLVRLQMDLASAERRLDDDPAAARRLLVEAREQAHDTLEELRALSRGQIGRASCRERV